MSTDLALLRRYHEQSDAYAFRELVQAHAGMVVATARRVTRDAALADDVAQETFLELARHAPQVRESVGAWLHRVARRRACNVVRAAGTRRRYEEAATVAGAEPDRTEASWAEIEPLIDEALDALEDNQRVAVVEHFLEGRTQQEVATRLGVSQATVSRTLEAGIAELRAQLRRRDVAAGVGLGLLLAGHAQVAPSAALVASLGKIGVAGVGAGAASLATTGWWAAWGKTVVVVAVSGALAVGAGIFWFGRKGDEPVGGQAGAVPVKAPPAPAKPAPQPEVPSVERDWIGRAFCPMCAMEHTGGRRPDHGIFVHAEQRRDVIYDLKLPQPIADFHARFCGVSMMNREAIHVHGTVGQADNRPLLTVAQLERAKQ